MMRPARPADLARLRAIQSASLAEPWPDLLEPAIDGAGAVVVAVPDAEGDGSGTPMPVGYAAALRDDTSAYLAEIAVAPEHRREGYGSRLLDDLCSRLARSGVERLTLTVRLDDEGARAFYDAHGFRVRSLVPEHYENGDALRMATEL
jgi:ribosomal-protein-alanine N-acetyltransferase